MRLQTIAAYIRFRPLCTGHNYAQVWRQGQRGGCIGEVSGPLVIS